MVKELSVEPEIINTLVEIFKNNQLDDVVMGLEMLKTLLRTRPIRQEDWDKIIHIMSQEVYNENKVWLWPLKSRDESAYKFYEN